MREGDEWRGLDTETQDGRAVLVATDRASLSWPRSFDQIARFLVAHGRRYWAYNMDYDARACLAFCPRSVLSALAFSQRAVLGKWRLFYLPRKVLRVSDGKRHANIFDVSQFFPGGLDDQARQTLKERKLELPSGWITRMGWALGRYPKRVIDYCVRDADLARRLGEYVRGQFEAFGVNFDRPISSGSLFRQHFGDRMHFNCGPDESRQFRLTYAGGRIEVVKRGFVRGLVTLWDINSAYPAVLAELLDPKRCDLRHTKRMTDGVQIGAYLIRAKFPETDYVGPVAVKDDRGLTVYPVGVVKRWVDRATAELCFEFGKAELLDAWEYVPRQRELLFPEVAKLYLERRKRPEVGLAIKLLLNAGYGKLAQAVSKWRRPYVISEGGRYTWHAGEPFVAVDEEAGFTHYGLASYVTGQTRAWVYRAMRTVAARRMLFAATDSLALLGPTPPRVRVGKGLGEWSCKVKANAALVIGSGVYALREGRTWRVSVRGFEKGLSIVQVIRAAKRSIVNVPVRRVATLRETVRRSDWERLNVIRKVVRGLDLNFDRKRFWPGRFGRGAEVFRGLMDSEPWYFSPKRGAV